jgi:UDP-N-acetylglucosamine 2-epimerase
MHPRTKRRIKEFGFDSFKNALHVIEPVGYLDFISLMVNSKAVISDSGGVQVETTYLGKSCVSVMETTSHLYTLNKGTNMLANYENIYDVFKNHNKSNFYRDEYADGKAAERIIKCLKES